MSTFKVWTKDPGEAAVHQGVKTASNYKRAGEAEVKGRPEGALVIVLDDSDTLWVFQAQTQTTLVDEEYVNHGVTVDE